MMSLEAERFFDELLDVIREVHSEHGDDLCFMSIDRIFVAAGLPVPDRSIGDKNAMLRNCDRFVSQLCTGSKAWPSYVELEERIKRLEAACQLTVNATKGFADRAPKDPVMEVIWLHLRDAADACKTALAGNR